MSFERKALQSITNLMKRIFNAFLAVSSLLIYSQHSFAQQSRNQEIIQSVTDYFFLERENIHAHFDKNVFMTNESIWFKGYVFHRKKNTPFFTTVNIYASLMDADGKVIETKLLYGNIGSFDGSFKLNSNFKSGKYYIQFYTNWMNNFFEDESSVYEIAVINPETGPGNALGKPNLSKINIDLNPEGGTLLSGTANTIGMHVSDCNHNPLQVTSADITDASGKLVKKIPLNKLGYGKIDLPADNTQGYKAIVTLDDKKYEQAFPTAQLKGIALEVNSYSITDQTMIKIRTNKTTLEAYNARPIYVLIHQDEKSTVLELTLNDKKTKEIIVIPNKDIADGLNTIRILDSDLNQLSERMFFKYPKPLLTTDLIANGKTEGKVNYKGKVNYPNMNISVSVLPENTISFDDSNDIYGSLMLLPYLDNKKKASGRHYFATLSKGKMYELDLYLMNQKSKYKWNTILHSPPGSNYTFDMGINLKGTLPSGIDPKLAKVRMYSLTSGIDELTEINDKREFYFNNLVIPDSSYVNFTLVRRGVEPKQLSIAPQLLNSGRKFNKPYVPEVYSYAPQTTETSPEEPNIFKQVNELDEVKVEGKTTLKYANSFGNGNLHAYKISETQTNLYTNLVQYIKTYGGFYVDDHNGDLKIYSRTINSVRGAMSGPIIYIDNVQLLNDYSWLTNITLEEVEEIYMSNTAIVPSVRNYVGVIKIYLRKGTRPNRKDNTPQIMVRNSFEKMMPFENVTYNSVDDKGFENFGVIDWKATIMTDENGEFNLALPKMSSKPLKVLIEGFSADGKLISEIKTIN